MTQLWMAVRGLKIWSDSRGQDLVEYALAAGFVAGAAITFSPALGSSVLTIFGKVAAELQMFANMNAAPSN